MKCKFIPCFRFAALFISLSLTSLWATAQTFGEAGNYAAAQTGVNSTSANTNLATGTIAPSLPLLTLPGVSGGIPVGLQYISGNGVRVNDIASEVGLGWVLTGGGSITREIKGRPDDSEYGWFTSLSYSPGTSEYSYKFFGSRPWYQPLPFSSAGDIVTYFKKVYTRYVTDAQGTYQVDYGKNQINILDWLYPASQMADYPKYKPNQYVPGQPNITSSTRTQWLGVFFTDNEPDIYTLTLPSGKLQFIFDPAGNPVPLQAQNIKIEALNLGNRLYKPEGLLHEFLVTTSDGVKYYFGTPYDANLPSGACDYKEAIAVSTKIVQLPNQPSKEDYKCVNKWHLRKMVYPSGEEVSYTNSFSGDYNYTVNTYLQQDWVYTMGANNSTRPYAYDPLLRSLPRSSAWLRRYTVATKVESSDCEQLAAISSQQGTLRFAYQSAARQDVGGSTKALASLQMSDKAGALVKRIDLIQNYDYSGQTVPDAKPYDRYHLMLTQVIDRGMGCDYTNLYTFGYNSTAFCRNTPTTDEWGYLNTLTYPSDNTLVGPCSTPLVLQRAFVLSGRSQQPNLTYAQALILQSITTATGAVKTFTYESHEISLIYPDGTITPKLVGGLRVKRIVSYDGINHSGDIIENYSYNKAASPDISSGIWGDPGQYAKLQVMHGSGPSSTSDYFPTEEEIRGITPNCVSSQGGYNGQMDHYYVMRSSASLYQYAADYIDYSCVTVSNGAKGKTRYEFTSWADSDHRDYAAPETRQRANDLNVCPDDPLNPAKRGEELPLPFSLDFNGIGMGYADPVSANFPCRSSRSAERGLPLQVTQLDNNSTAVAVTTNKYDFQHPGLVLPITTAVVVKPDMDVFGFSQYSKYFQLYYYNVASQWCPLVESTQIVYDQKANGSIAKSLATTTQVQYSNFFPSKTTKFTSVCTSPSSCSKAAASPAYVTEFRRAQDFANGSTSATYDQTTTAGLLRQAGMTAAVIEQENYTILSGGNKIPQGASLTEYQSNNGHVVPYRSWATPAYLTAFTPASTQTSGGSSWSLVKDAKYQRLSEVTGYSADALPINTIGRDGISRTTIWGYNHTLPIATVTNGIASTSSANEGLVATAAHTSFEEDGANGIDGDGWSVPPTFSTEAKTGARSEKIVIGDAADARRFGAGKTMIIPANSRHGKLIYSCWVKVPKSVFGFVNLNLVVAGQNPNNGWQASSYRLSPDQDWQYAERVIDLDDPIWNAGLAASDNLRLLFYPWCPNDGLSLLVDEVRIHRADAQMQTTTYAPLLGRTSATDASGVTTYYTYDSSGQPKLVINQSHDIVQRTRQHLVGQTPARPNANFNSPGSAAIDCPVSFTAEYGDCAGTSSFTWNFGDGTAAVSGGPIQTHIYSQVGDYTVSLLVANRDKGAARTARAVAITPPYDSHLQVEGATYVDLCETPDPAPVTLTAISNGCSSTFTYQWQTQYGSGNWINIGNGQSIAVGIRQGSTSVRCIVGVPGGSDNSNSPNLEVVTLTGVYSDPLCVR